VKTALRTMPAGQPANTNTDPKPIPEPIEHERVVKLIALGMFTGGLNVYQQLLLGGQPNTPVPIAQSPSEIMTADDVAEFLGVDRNTVYEYAGRGAIPHQRLGKRILFRRGALVSWLDASCKATSTRKG
jgi:excisionase family DNA binding protein